MRLPRSGWPHHDRGAPTLRCVEEPTIYTIGHGDASFTDIEALLAHHLVQTLIDVRSQPYSRHAPDFNREALVRLTAAAGLGFRWMGDRLGGRPTAPDLLAADGAPDWRRLAATPAFRGAIAEVAELARGGRTAVLCAERDPTHCHRAVLLAPALAEAGLHVAHILPDGSLEPHHPTLFGPG